MASTKSPSTKKKSSQSPVQEGYDVFIRTVTSFFTGHIVEVTEHEIVLTRAAWIADTGRFSQAMDSGEFNEVEPYPDDMVVSVARGGVIDVARWQKALPRSVK